MQYISKIKTRLNSPLTYVWACVFIDILNLSILNPFLPQIMLDMGGNLTQIGLVFSINALLGLFSNLIWGSLSDRIGRKPVLLICRFGTLIGFIFLLFAHSIQMIFVARIIDGIFSRMEPIALTMISDLVPFEKRSKEMSRIGAGWIIGGLIGPIAGAYAASQGITKLGLINSVLVAATILITFIFIKESLDKRSLANNNSRSSKATTITDTLSLLKSPVPRSLILQSLFSKLPYFTFMSTTSVFMSTRLDLSITQIGTLLSTINVVNLIIRILFFQPLLEKIGDKHIMRMGYIFYVTGFIWLAFAGQVWEFFGISVLLSFATSCSADVIVGVISKSVKKNELGRMLGLNSAMESISLVVGPVIGNTLISSSFTAGYGLLFAILSLFALFVNVGTAKINSPTFQNK